jgi:threonine aldolase
MHITSDILVDLRSDTVTRPGPAMRKAMAEAPVGDVVFNDDPTVNRLEALVAERLGMETSLFVPTGTMGNQVALGALAGPGDAVLMPAFAHVARWEGAGLAATFGVQPVHIPGDDGLPTVSAFELHRYGPHPKAPRPAAISLENTHNWAGGRAYSASKIAERVTWARQFGLECHLDGARLMNASIATGDSPAELAKGFTTVSLCLSKGLGAPVGTCIGAPKNLRPTLDRLRHRLGGGWRQAGLLAAAALYALEHHIERLADDHARATTLGELLVRHDIGRPLHPIETNIVQFEIHPRFGHAKSLVERALARGVHFFPTGEMTARLVTHLDVDDAALRHVDEVFGTL